MDMKNLFDETENGEVMERFFSRKPTDEQLKIREKSVERRSLSELNHSLKILIAFAIFLAVIFVAIELMTNLDDAIATPVRVFLIVLVTMGVFIFICKAYKLRASFISTDDDFCAKITPEVRDILNSLNVPEDAFSVDMYYLDDEDKDNRSIMPLEMLIYTDGPELCIVEAYNELAVYTIPNVTFTSIERITQHSEIVFWSKALERLDERILNFNISQTQNKVYCEYYYSLRILSNGEEYELLFAPYEKEKLSNLTGINVI